MVDRKHILYSLWICCSFIYQFIHFHTYIPCAALCRECILNIQYFRICITLYMPTAINPVQLYSKTEYFPFEYFQYTQ